MSGHSKLKKKTQNFLIQ